MATTAFPATAIFDSGATGRDLIQSADQAAAQAAIGIDPSDYGLLDSDNTWTGDNTFDEPITASELAGVSSLMLTAGGGSPTYFKFGSTLAWIVDGTTIRPTDSLGSRDIGIYNRRIGDVMAFRFGATESYKLYNLGTEGDANTEYLDLSWATNKAYISVTETGTGIGRDLVIDSGSSVRISYNGNERVLFSNTEIRPVIDDYTSFGTATRRYSYVFSYDADFIGTTTLRTFDDGAGNSSSVQTQNSSNDSFFLHRTWTGTSGGASSWIGLKNDYNSTGTAASWIGLSPNTFRLELGNGLRAVWQLSGNQHMLNMNLYPYTDNTWQNGTFNRAWSETWQHATKTLGSYVDSSNYGYLSIEPDGDDYLIKANSLGTTADAGITIQTSQKSAGGNHGIVLDADYIGQVSFLFGGNSRGYWNKDTLAANVAVTTNNSFTITRTWNNAATVFEGFKADITDTASDASSSLLNLKVGGTSYLRLQKDGKLLFEKNGGSAAIVQNVGGISIVGDNGSTVQSFDQYFNYTYKTFRPISDNQHLGYVSRRFLVKANDVYSKGKIRSYNLGDETAVDAEYLNLHWLSDHAYLTVEATGTGTARQFSIGTHTNGSIRFNHGSNTLRFSIGGVTATKAYLNSTGLTVYGRVDPQGNKTRDLGNDSTARWRVGHLDTCDLADGRINQMTSSSSDPSTSEYANDGDWGVHKNTSSSTIYLACNSGGTIYKVALSGGTPPP